jgi:hypothetical protein
MLGALPAPRVATHLQFRGADQRRSITAWRATFRRRIRIPASRARAARHGSPVLAEALVRRAVELGARRAHRVNSRSAPT